MTPHAYRVASQQRPTQLAKRRQEFVQSALLAEQEVAEYGLVYDANEVFNVLRDRLAGHRAQQPKPGKLNT